MLISLLFLLLFSNALTLRRDKSILFSRVVILSFIIISFLGFNNTILKGLEKGIGIYGGLFNVTMISQTFNIFILIITTVILILNAFYPRKLTSNKYFNNLMLGKLLYNKDIISNRKSEQFKIIEYPLIIVFILCGAIFLISTADLVSLFLSIELQSYGLYIISTIYRNSELSTGSGLTYFLLGGLASCFILLGSALLYTNTGTTSLDNIYIITQLSQHNDLANTSNWYEPYYIHLSLIILAVGFLFKSSAAPFHFWSPDVYDGIPTIVTTFVSNIAKISIFVFFLELVYYTEYNIFDFSWKNILLTSSLFSLIIGSVLGLTQFRIKRLLAYSTISHIGFILLALSINSVESIQSYIFYILQYSIANLNTFIILVTIGYTFYLYAHQEKKYKDELIDPDNSPIQLIKQIKGYFYINPFIAISLSITLFSFIGIPPTIGFFAKQMVLSAALDSGYIFLALIAILTSVIGAVYYLNINKYLFFYKHEYHKINPASLKELVENDSYYDIKNRLDIENSSITESSMSTYKNGDINNILLTGYLSPNKNVPATVNKLEEIKFKTENIIISSSLSSSISVITLILILFIYIPDQWFNIVNILSLILFKA